MESGLGPTKGDPQYHKQNVEPGICCESKRPKSCQLQCSWKQPRPKRKQKQRQRQRLQFGNRKAISRRHWRYHGLAESPIVEPKLDLYQSVGVLGCYTRLVRKMVLSEWKHLHSLTSSDTCLVSGNGHCSSEEPFYASMSNTDMLASNALTVGGADGLYSG